MAQKKRKQERKQASNQASNQASGQASNQASSREGNSGSPSKQGSVQELPAPPDDKRMRHEGWYLDPAGSKVYRYHDGERFTKKVTTDIKEVSMPVALFGKKLFDLRPEYTPMIFGILAAVSVFALIGLIPYAIGIVLGSLGIAEGVLHLRIGRTTKLIVGTIISALALIVAGGFFAIATYAYVIFS
ncbi:MAG: DUF2510 domain-containing protein [Coriobacteriales bacterium]|nr:DUF2510 domain-containing protein [Coriobacteriales bacterium]